VWGLEKGLGFGVKERRGRGLGSRYAAYVLVPTNSKPNWTPLHPTSVPHSTDSVRIMAVGIATVGIETGNNGCQNYAME